MRTQLWGGLAVLFVAASCSDDTTSTGSGGSGGSTTDASAASTATTTSTTGGEGGAGGGAAAPFQVRGSVEQVHVWMAEPETTVELRDADGAAVATGTTDALGSFIFRGVAPGEGYAVAETDLDPPVVVSPVDVMSAEGSQPGQDFYDGQTLVAGVNYITTRDGTKLSVYVTMPGPEEDGPYPTVLNYSGYDPSKPGAPIEGYEGLCGTYPVLCDAPTDPSALVSALMGYATVSVNMRGTGCSGGAYDYFEELQLLDGYDIIETTAAQPWVLHGHVGMTGLSYPGISQMFVARTRPPSLAAITPLSVLGGTYSTTRPGGIFNKGFALAWITSVLDKADPYGQGWEQGRVDEGDTVCEENQLLHGQKVDVIDQALNTPFYADALVGRVDPTTFVSGIEVPVFLASSWQDEQTGPLFFTLLDQFTSAPVTRFTVYNGVHIDGFAPQVLVEWKTFLDLYVAQRVPSIASNVRTLAPALFQTIFKQSLQLPPDRFADHDTWEEARDAFEAEDPVRALFEDGGGENVGAPEATFELGIESWPPPETAPLRLFFQGDGTLAEDEPADDDAPGVHFLLDPEAGDRGILAPGGNVWDPLPDYDWAALRDGYAVAMQTAPLADDLVMLGTGSVDLWLRAPVDDADLEVNLTEVRPDGQEMYVQSGWLRASVRALADSAIETWPEHTYREEDAEPLEPGEWTPMRVGIAGFSHVFRAGSRIRVTVDTPGDSRAEWRFDLKTFEDEVGYDVGTSATHPSSVVLPVLEGVTAETPLPACPSLRGQPCRAYAAHENTPAAP